jgi:hypothetical protein
MRNGSSIWEPKTLGPGVSTPGPWRRQGGYQTSYVFHLENPVRFQREIKVTIEHGHGNHLANEMSSVAYWYAAQPTAVIAPPSVEQRMPILCDNQGNWLYDTRNQCPGPEIVPSEEMQQMKARWAEKSEGERR